MNINDDCIHLLCRYLKTLDVAKKEIEMRPVYDKCALDMINPYYGCAHNCAGYEPKK